MTTEVPEASAQRSRPFRSALAKPDFRRLVASMSLSTAGDWLYNIALLVFVFERTDSATWVAAATIMRLSPYVLFGALGGAIAERNDGRRVMVVSDVARAGLMVGLVVVAATDGPVVVAVVLAFVTTAAGTAYLPAVVKAVPTMVGEHDLAAANAVRSTVENVSVVVGPAIGGAVLALGSPTWAFAANAVTFLLSAVVVRRLQPLPPAAPEDAESMLRSIAEGWRVLRGSANARWLVAVGMYASGTYGLQTVFLVLVSEELLDTGSNGIGYLYAGLGLGGVVVAGLTTRLADSRRPSLSLAAAMVLSALPLVALAAIGHVALAVVVVAVQGAAWIVLDVVSITTLQRTIPPAAVARAFGITDTLIVLSMVAGSLTAPLVVELLDLEGALVASGAVLGLLALAMLPRLLGFDRAAEARRLELAPHVRVLRQLPIFEGASTRVLESLASSAVREPVSAGAVIVREGEPARSFYVLVDGRAEVVVRDADGTDRLVYVVEAGDYFGEIGLVRRRPRTATVRAAVDSVVDRIDGDAFLDAVNGDEGVGAALEPRIAVGLRRPDVEHATARD